MFIGSENQAPLTQSQGHLFSAKFKFHKDKEYVLTQAKNLRGTNFACNCPRFPTFPQRRCRQKEASGTHTKERKVGGTKLTVFFEVIHQ